MAFRSHSILHTSAIMLLLLVLQDNLHAKRCPKDSHICGRKSNSFIKLNQSCKLNCVLQLEGKKNVTVEGNGFVINCMESFGIIILNSPQVVIQDLTIENCGMNKFDRKSALTISHCSKISLTKVNIIDSAGTGLSLLGSRGSVTIDRSEFVNNTIKNNSSGGGGVYIQHSSSEPTYYLISNSNFTSNRATANVTTFLPSEDRSHHFGKGGGLHLDLRNASTVINITDNLFSNNFANRGGGLFLGLEDDCTNNSIFVLHSVFDANLCVTQKIPKTFISSGGGLAFLDHTKKSNGRNALEVTDSNFTNNTAYYGGGLSVGMRAFHASISDSTNRFTLQDCRLSGNMARIGAAVDMFSYTTSELSSSSTLRPTLINVNIHDNEGIYSYTNDEVKGNTFSTVHLETLTASFKGENHICDNKASGIGLDDAVIVLLANSSIVIENNMAIVGGGIAAIGSSEILLHPYTNLAIVGNSVADRGGGIYSAQTLDTYSLYVFTCFIKYLDRGNTTLTHPDQWMTNITIMHNTADGQPSSIFASSIYPCVWPSINLTKSNVTEDIVNTFCSWKSWKMDEDCRDSIHTLPRGFTQREYYVCVYPTNATRIEGFEVLDDLNHTVTNSTVFSVCTSDGKDQKCAAQSTGNSDLNRDMLTMEGDPNQYSLLVQTTGFRSVSTNLNVTIQECPVGYSVQEESGRCTCSREKLPRVIVNCANYSFLILDVLLGHCIGIDSKYGTVVARCPYTICSETITDPFIHVFSTKEELNERFCGAYNRTGTLCSECIGGTGINVFSPTYTCIKCENPYIGWIKGILAALVPQVVFFAVVIIFHIGITAPSMNAYIFFSHVSLLPIQVLLVQIASKLDTHHRVNGTDVAGILSKLVLGPYRLWTFDYPEMVGMEACFSQHFQIMHALAFKYVQAFFPTVLVLLTLALIELHARNCKPVVYMWKPLCYVCIRLRRNWELRTSVIDAFASVVLLSYSKVVNTSISLLTRNSVIQIENSSTPREVKVLLDLDTSTEYLRDQHVYFAISAILVLCTFGLLPPLLLTLYPYRWFKKLIGLAKLDKWHGLYAFVETFQGCYKDGTNGTPDRRWFAGMYFIFRIIIFLEFALINDVSSMFAKLAFTYIMFLLFFIMLRPYKRDYYNYLDGAFLGVLISINLFIYYLITYAQQRQKLDHPIWRFTYVLLLLPTLYLMLYVAYLISTRSKYLKRHCLSRLRGVRQRSFRFFAETRFHGNIIQDDAFSILGGELVPGQSPLDNLSEVPDRIDNPDRYGDFDRSSGLAASYHNNGTRRPGKEERERLL